VELAAHELLQRLDAQAGITRSVVVMVVVMAGLVSVVA
jgi:hypothetical protein